LGVVGKFSRRDVRFKIRALWEGIHTEGLMQRLRLLCVIGSAIGISLGSLAIVSCGSSSEPLTPHVAGKSREDVGRYLILVAGCNDCHTPGWKRGAKVPETEWLTGVPEGWRGPWGTTYASNLRLAMQNYTEEIFIKTMRARNARPPMPWASLHAMTDDDLAGIYAFIKSLGPAGEPMPADLPPGEEPKTPYVSSFVVQPGASAATKPQ
jgi:mono/diheme cytochrome c family protein